VCERATPRTCSIGIYLEYIFLDKRIERLLLAPQHHFQQHLVSHPGTDPDQPAVVCRVVCCWLTSDQSIAQVIQSGRVLGVWLPEITHRGYDQTAFSGLAVIFTLYTHTVHTPQCTHHSAHTTVHTPQCTADIWCMRNA
jgi:hypothetical protein